jgi:hypothetical protein
MEIVFDEMFGKDQFASIDKFEIDCGLIGVDNWEEEFITHAILKLKEGLVQVNRKAVDVKEIEETTAAETFFFFLENGFLPWNNRIESVAELERTLKVDENLILRLKKLIRLKVKAAERLAWQFSETFVSKIIAAFTEIKMETYSFSAIIEKVSALESDKLHHYRIGKPLINEAILYAFTSENPRNRDLQFITYLMTRTESNAELSSELKRIAEKLGVNSESQSRLNEEDLSESELLKIQVKASDKPGTGTPASLSALEQATKSKKHFHESAKPADTIYITNAGLVLLHPFLPALFTNLMLVEKNTWIDETSKQKAVLSMEFLVTGMDETEEYDLALNKILCGIEIDEVVPTTILPDEFSKTECDVLLMELIKHWEVLKNTSIAGLREGFLQRHGKLSRVDDGWLLQVEQKAIDVLLNHLPWGFGIIKLPWMNEMLVVEWT